jgi:hypothetical protein
MEGLQTLLPEITEDACHPFETKAFFTSWWETLASKFNPTARYGQLVTTNKPILKSHFKLKVVHIAGWNNYYYQNISEERMDELFSLNRSEAWDYFDIYINTTYTNPNLLEVVHYHGFPIIELPAIPTPVIDISQGWEHYWTLKSSKYCRDITKKLAAAKHLDPHLIFFKGKKGIQDFFEQFFPYHLKYWALKTGGSYFQDLREQAFILSWAEHLEANNQLQLVGLNLGGKIANMSMNILNEDILYCYLTINSGYFSNFYPGLLSMHLMIKNACKQGIQKVDIGPGDTDYKKKLATHLEIGRQILIINPKSLFGRLYGKWKADKTPVVLRKESNNRGIEDSC